MSARVSGEVWQHSTADGTALLVLLAIADQAGDDGVTWLQVESREGKKSITSKARCSKATAHRAIASLVNAGELQVVQVRRGTSFINVYRVVVGRIAEVNVDYDRLPFALPHPFGAQSQFETVPMVSSERVQGLKSERSRSHPETSVLSIDLDPSLDPSEVQEDHPDFGGEQDLAGGRSKLRERLDLVRRERRRQAPNVCPECEVGGGAHQADCISGKETSRRSYRRFIDEVAADPSYPLEEIELVVAMWTDIDPVDRQELFERAEHIRAAAITAGEKAAA